MGATSDGLRVPLVLRDHVSEIFAITDRFCHEHLDSEYACLCRELVAKLARKRPSPLKRGELRIWAAGAVYAVGANNFLFDPSETPHLSADRLSELLNVPKSTLAGKAKRIRDTLDLDAQMDPGFCRRDVLAGHPLAWLVEVNGMVVDARWLPPEVQAEVRLRGLIPDIPLPKPPNLQGHVVVR